ncbi:MAG: hypothetical protein JWP61_1200 [Friedmanniella sp.]|nr:hypothetical protein [Friedmanniella sp.]
MRLTVQRVVDPEVAASLYPTYLHAYEALRTRAAARHVLTAAEFAAEMSDPRIEKFVVWGDEDAGPVALTTLTDDVTAVPWASPEFYRARYPDAAARGALFYLGYTLVDATRRRSAALLYMVEAINRRVQEAGGVVGFDVCGYNEAQGVGRQIARLFGSCERIDALDTQSYYAADYRVPVKAPSPPEPPAAEQSAEPVRLVTLAERPELADLVPALLASRWPSFLRTGASGQTADAAALLQTDPRRQVLLVADSGTLVGAGLSVPLAWDGSLADLPTGRDDALRRSTEPHRRTHPAEATCAWSVTVAAGASGRGHASRLLRGLQSAASTVGSGVLVSPLRPTLKARYPLTSIERYLGWRTPQGESFDPWLRQHVRLGARVLAAAPRSLTVTGTVAEWQRWVDQPLPGTGSFVIPDGLAPLYVDSERDTAVYQEPNVWVLHPTP